MEFVLPLPRNARRKCGNYRWTAQKARLRTRYQFLYHNSGGINLADVIVKYLLIGEVKVLIVTEDVFFSFIVICMKDAAKRDRRLFSRRLPQCRDNGAVSKYSP